MPGEMDAELRNTLRSLQAAIEGVGRAQKKTTDEVVRFANEAAKAFRGTKKVVDDSDKGAKEHAKTWRDVGQALSRLPGPLGDIVGRLTSLQSANPTMARLGLYSAAAGVAIGLVVKGLERSALQARESAAAWRTMTEAMLSANQASLAVGTAGAAQAGERRRLVGAGPEAVAHAKEIAESKTGISEEDANGGVSAIYSKYGSGARSRATVEMARALHQTGAMSFTEAANSLIEYGADASLPGVGRAAAARVYVNKTGRRGVDPSEAFSDALASTGGDKYLQGAAAVTVDNNLQRGVERNAVTSGAAKAASGKALADARDPVAAAVLAVANANARAVDELKRVADGSNAMLELIKHYTTGSNRDAQQRAQQAAEAGAAVYQPAAPAG